MVLKPLNCLCFSNFYLFIDFRETEKEERKRKEEGEKGREGEREGTDALGGVHTAPACQLGIK